MFSMTILILRYNSWVGSVDVIVVQWDASNYFQIPCQEKAYEWQVWM